MISYYTDFRTCVVVSLSDFAIKNFNLFPDLLIISIALKQTEKKLIKTGQHMINIRNKELCVIEVTWVSLTHFWPMFTFDTP